MVKKIFTVGIMALCLSWGTDSAVGALRKYPTVIFYTAYCYEADMEGHETLFPSLPSETTVNTLERMVLTSEAHIAYFREVYGYQNFRLISASGGSLVMDVNSPRPTYIYEEEKADEKFHVEMTAFWNNVNKAFSGRIQCKVDFANADHKEPATLELVCGLKNEWPVSVGRRLPSEKGRRALILVITPYIITVEDQSSYDRMLLTYRSLLDQIPGSEDLGAARVFHAVNEHARQRKHKIKRRQIDEIIPLSPPPPPPSDDGSNVYSYQFDVSPAPQGGWDVLQQAVHYPEMAQRMNIEGVVMVYAKIDEGGNIIAHRIKRSIPFLNDAAVDAIKRVKWRPAIYNRQPITVWINIPINFKMR